MTPAHVAVGAAWGRQLLPLPETGSAGSVALYQPPARPAVSPAVPLRARVAYLLLGHRSPRFVILLEQQFPDGAPAKIVCWGMTSMIPASRSTAQSSSSSHLHHLDWEIHDIYNMYLWVKPAFFFCVVQCESRCAQLALRLTPGGCASS